MGQTRIVWTPRTHGTGTRTLDLGAHPVVVEFGGGRDATALQTISQGRKAVTRLLNAFDRFTIRIERVGPDEDATIFHLLWAWWSHAMGGGTFSFALDSAKASSTLMNGAHAATDTTIVVDSITGVSDTDWLWLEAEDDDTVFERVKVSGAPAGSTIALAHGIVYDYPDNSIVRHAEYFPSVVVVGVTQPMRERPAPGVHVWDLEFVVESVT